MVKRSFLFLFLILSNWLGASDYSIAFVHVGPRLPKYLPDALAQARLFNKSCPIYLIADPEALASLDETAHQITLISSHLLNETPHHRQFTQKINLSGLFRYASERFFYLEEFMSTFGVHTVFHMENDVMLYADLEQLLPLFLQLYPGKMAATFDSDKRCIPGLIYFSDANTLQKLTQFIASRAETGKADMEFISDFKDLNRDCSDYLPIVPSSYAATYPLANALREKAKNPALFSNYFSNFQSIFDAACLGQYWGGIDPIHSNSRPGFINETCFFNPQYLQFEWREDEEGRQVPFAAHDGASFRINNLHIHCKNLQLFSSLNKTPPAPPRGPDPLKKITYSFTSDPIDVVIVCDPKDRPHLESCIQGIRQNGEKIGNITVVSEAKFTDSAHWYDEKNFPFSPSAIAAEKFSGNRLEATRFLYSPHSQAKPIFHQLIKLYAPLTIPGLSPNVLVLDANTIFLKPVAFLSESNEPLIGPLIKTSASNLSHLLPSVQSKTSRTAHQMLFQRCVLEDFFEQLENFHGMKPWKAIVRCIDDVNQPGFSGFAVYDHFMKLRTDQGKIRPLQCGAEDGDYAVRN
jgi:hypothetical protein